MSREFTVGIEEEYQLVEPESGELRSRARSVLAMDWAAEVKQEMQEAAIEIGTSICSDSTAALAELKRLRFHAATTAATNGLTIVAASLHPTSLWEGQRLMLSEDRYREIANRYGRIAIDQFIYGMHVHVGVPERYDRVRIMNALRAFSPVLIALSASSPYYEGRDTRFSSYRSVIWRRWPNAGIPPFFASTAEHDAYVGLLLKSGAISDPYNLYWSIRAHPGYPTVELRMPDIAPNAQEGAAVAGLARLLVVAAAEGELPEEPFPELSGSASHALMSANEWRAARGGLNATLVEPSAEDGRVTMRAHIDELLERLLPWATALAETAALETVSAIADHGNGADRMRQLMGDGEDFAALLRWQQAETLVGTGVDRRDMQRSVSGVES